MKAVQSGRDRFRSEFNVSRETMLRLDRYDELLRRWTPSINLISKTTVPLVWDRHFRDSAQIFNIVSLRAGHWVDIGAGGGLPGLVLAILAQDWRPKLRFSLVESDRRKTVFLQTVIRELSLSVDVFSQRIEKLPPLSADVVSARALAPLTTLLEYAEPHLVSDGRAVFPKGMSFKTELSEALAVWSFRSQEHTSITDGNAKILCLGDIKRV